MSEDKNGFSDRDITIFEPSTRELLLDYPELKEYEAFTNLKSPRDLKFVWYVSNRTSPIIREPKKRRIKIACEYAYSPSTLRTNVRVKAIYEECEIPQDIVEAIDVMARFNPSFRMRAKLLNEHAFEELQSLTYLTNEEKMSQDLDDKNKFASLLIKTSNALPGMIHAMETGYGVRIKESKEKQFELQADIEDVIERVEKQ